MKTAFLGITAAGLALACLAAPLAAQTAARQESNMDVVPVLSVAGSGQARVTPDVANVRLGVLAQAETARAAQDQVNRTAAAILEAVRKQGIPQEQIQTSELNLNPVYSQGRPDGQLQEPKIVGYQASNVVSIRLEDLNKVGPVVDAGLAAGANRLDGVYFGLKNEGPARAAALTAAVGEARTKAEALARALKVRLVEILEVTEGGVAVYTPTFQKAGRMAMAMESSMADTPVSSGQVSVDASVTLRYRIAPCAAGEPCP
jgi:uncharacterized protein